MTERSAVIKLPDWLVCRIRNEVQGTSSTNKGNKTGGSKSPLGHYPPHYGKQAMPADNEYYNERSPERSGNGRVRSQVSTGLRRSQF